MFYDIFQSTQISWNDKPEVCNPAQAHLMKPIRSAIHIRRESQEIPAIAILHGPKPFLMPIRQEADLAVKAVI